ncbi:hypothetical protein JTB14_015544 [Gonioctena quinquepunctata]|nr:hypothetical protein JTB14_015544 [Gonioctena quinquepunctata]
MSLKELSEELEKRYGINFILTSELNQDAVENSFGQLRSRGGLDDHPTPMDLLFRHGSFRKDSRCGTTASSSSKLADQVEEDGLNNLSGWLAQKFNKTYPEMGDYTC